jgi:hypothetical protein
MIVLSLFDSTGTWAALAPDDAEVYAVDLAPKPLDPARERQIRGAHFDPIAADVRSLPDWLLARWMAAKPEDRILLMAPPCQALSRQRHLAGRQGGRTGPNEPSMTTADGLDLVRWCVTFATRWTPRIWCLENPGSSLAWTITPRAQRVLLGWWGFPAEKPTGLGGDFAPVVLPFPLPEIDPTAGGRRPSGARKGVGGVQAMPSYLRSRTPLGFAQAWWASQMGRL